MNSSVPFSSLWNRFAPTGVSAFALPVFDFFLNKQCHTVALADGWLAHGLYLQHESALFRSDVAEVDSKRQWRRMLFRWEDVWAIYQEGSLRVYAPTPRAAVEKLEELKRKAYTAGAGSDAFGAPRRGPTAFEDDVEVSGFLAH